MGPKSGTPHLCGSGARASVARSNEPPPLAMKLLQRQIQFADLCGLGNLTGKSARRHAGMLPATIGQHRTFPSPDSVPGSLRTGKSARRRCPRNAAFMRQRRAGIRCLQQRTTSAGDETPSAPNPVRRSLRTGKSEWELRAPARGHVARDHRPTPNVPFARLGTWIPADWEVRAPALPCLCLRLLRLDQLNFGVLLQHIEHLFIHDLVVNLDQAIALLQVFEELLRRDLIRRG